MSVSTSNNAVEEPATPGNDGGVASSMVSPGLSSSLHGSATTFGAPRGGGFGSAFQSPGVAPGGCYSAGGGTPGAQGFATPGGGGGDRRSKMVRERSRSVSGFARSSAPGAAKSSSAATGGKGGAAGDEVDETMKHIAARIMEDEAGFGPTLFASFCYRGMELIFAAVNSKDEEAGCYLMAIHARTRVPFQKCYIEETQTIHPSKDPKKGSKKATAPLEIVQLASHPSTGFVYAADNYGSVHSFYPVRADPMVEAYGKFRWTRGSVARCREVFGYPSLGPSYGSPSRTSLGARRSGKSRSPGGTNVTKMRQSAVPGALPGLSLESGEDGVEVCDPFSGEEPAPLSAAPTVGNDEVTACFHRRKKHRRSQHVPNSPGGSSPGLQSSYHLTDGQPPLPDNMNEGGNCEEHGVTICASMTERRVLVVHGDQLAVFDFSLPKKSSSNETSIGTPREALLLWTHELQGSIIDRASISGDGCAIALALRGEGVGVPYPFGVRTFVRDRDDGSGVTSNSEKNGMKRSGSKGSGKPPMPSNHRRTGSGMQALSASQTPPLPQKKPVGNNFDGLMENVFGDAPKTPTSADSSKPGASPTTPASPGRGGIIYKPAQFLVHSAPVTRLSFRGYGTLTSSAVHNSDSFHCEENGEAEEGNDLLLTNCAADCSVRIFSQNSWRQLMHWNSPPRSRADWVRGVTAANLGDLDSSPTSSESNKKKKEGRGEDGQLTPVPKEGVESSHSSRRESFNSSNENASVATEESGGINRALLSSKDRRGPPSTPGSFPSQSVPGTHAGAWIAELTFRDAFPALRLSRLSYMKTGGDDALPAHFESVAAILPPGSISERVVDDYDEEFGVDGGEFGMEVEGTWPAWDPWEEGRGGGRRSDANSGNSSNNATSNQPSSPMGSPPTTTSAPRWLGDGTDLGGSHVPPSELRITSNSPERFSKCVSQVEMPLWGDRDLGAMEFGSPLRHVVEVPGSNSSSNAMLSNESSKADIPEAFLDYESGSNLRARSSPDGTSIELSWRKCGPTNLEEVTLESEDGCQLRRFNDLGLRPLPLALPSLTLPDRNAASSLHWWPDENYGGPPRLAVLTRRGSLIVYEMPPPWSVLEPPMPSYDPFDDGDSRGSSVDSDLDFSDEEGMLLEEGVDSGSYAEGSNASRSRGSRVPEYEVSVPPHPDFGLGLRLEAQAEGMPPIAGSFKKHPLSGGRLPAERCGVIALGDELLAVNDVSLEGRKFEDAIAAVRRVGLDSRGAPLRMRFRRGRRRKTSTLGSSGGSGSRRRTYTSDLRQGSVGAGGNAGVDVGGIGGGASHATVEVGADAEAQQGYGRIIAVVRDAIHAASAPKQPASLDLQSAADSPVPMLLLPWNFGKGAVVTPKMYGGALVIWAPPNSRRMIRAARLEATLDADPERARFDVMGEASLEDEKNAGSGGAAIRSISHVSPTEKGWLLAVHDAAGYVSLLFIETVGATSNDGTASIRATFRHYPSVFNTYPQTELGNKHDPRDSFLLRPSSLELFGAMKRNSEGCKELTVWTALPQGMHCNDETVENTTSNSSEYVGETICIDNVPGLASGESILDFRWISSGRVDAFPWLVVFARTTVVVFHRSGVRTRWAPLAILYYGERLGAGSVSPYDALPHLVSSLRSAGLSNDEMELRNDWSPESMLASLCTEKEGAELAMRSHVRGLFMWLSLWMNSDEAGRPNWDGDGSLPNAPFRIVDDRTILVSDEDDEGDSPQETSANLFAAMALSPTKEKEPPSEEERLLSELLSALRPGGDDNTKDREEKAIGGTRHSREFMLAMSYGRPRPEVSEKKPLPPPLKNLTDDELRCLRAIGEVVSKPPKFEGLDSRSQLCIFCVSLMRRLRDDNVDSPRDSLEHVNSMPSYEGGRPTLAKQSTSEVEKRECDTIASGAMLSALMSDSQSKLLDRCRVAKGEKFTWEVVRAAGVPYWVRSDKTLASIADEIAQSVYKSTKNVMDCALYYVASRNFKKLRAIAATDRSDQGKKFLKFICDNDFSSERGRNTAEKNAYSLLRKRKYAHAASFFLLADPPMIKTALDVIKLQMKDVSLAFFVARLVEGAPKPSTGVSDGGGLTIGGGFSLSSMGGGGGFASGPANTGATVGEDAGENEVKFDSWEPRLGRSARSVLMPKDGNDVCFDSLRLMWLGRPNEAALRLSHTNPASYDGSSRGSIRADDLPFPSAFIAEQRASDATVLARANEIINFCAGPSLLRRMRPKKRVLWTSALLVSRALGRCGMEAQSARILLDIADPTYREKEDGPTKSGKRDEMKKTSSAPSSSIFDSYDAPPPKPKTAAPEPSQPSSDSMSSSIFDSFDAAPPKPKPTPPKQTDPMSSSIFDSFDAAPPKPKPPPKPTQADPMSSSIFDSYDAAPPKPKTAPPKQTQSDSMSSSIFDSFDAPPQKAKPPPKPEQSDPMSSSIFDSFSAAPQKPKPRPKPTQTGQMSSSIFDSFDAAPQRPKPPPKPTQSDPMPSSIFDSFDAAPQKPKPPPKPTQSDPMSSSIFDSFDAAPQRQPPKSSGRPPKTKPAADEAVEPEKPFKIPSFPTIWNEWRERLLIVAASRRFLRETARIISGFDGEPGDAPMEDFADRDYPLVPTGAAEVLHNSCDGEALMGSVAGCLSELSASFGVSETAIIEQALESLSGERRPRRIVFSVILHCLLGRGDLAEDVVRDAASFQMNNSEFMALSNDLIVDGRDTKYYTSSLCARKESSNVIWQLELCLWLDRGGAFDMSSIALKETLLAIRVGLASIAWGRCHHTLDTLIKAEPDCPMDFDAGRNLWRSTKIIVVSESTVDGIDGVTSGGWEFLVDCRREEATEMLRDGRTGQFLIRPHPQDPGVFTLSFKTNLVPTEPSPTANYDEAGSVDKKAEEPPGTPADPPAAPKKVVKRDDVVQHAIIRLSDSGFRCGSFGPFATLVKLLHAVSDSLPFELRFGDPPVKGIISERGLQASPNSFLFRKMALHSKAQYFQYQSSRKLVVSDVDDCLPRMNGTDDESPRGEDDSLHRRFGLFAQLLFLTELRKQLCAVAAAEEDEPDGAAMPAEERIQSFPDINIDDDFDGSLSEGSLEGDDEEAIGVASRMVKPLLNWVRSREIDIVHEVTPMIIHDEQGPSELSVTINASGNEFEVPSNATQGDSMIRKMIQTGSGVDFRTLRVGEAGNSVIVVLFGKQDAVKWLMANQTGNDEAEAQERLKAMELSRVIEPITSHDLSIPKSYAASHPATESRYRFVDPWEVEALESRSGETASAALGRGRYRSLSVGLIAGSCEKIIRAAGGLHLLGLWSTLKGGITLTKALCSAHPSWERDAGGDLLMKKGFLMEPSPYDNSIRQHLYGNHLFRRLGLPQRFLALVQVELLDLKNVTSPSGSSSLTAYALLRLKRRGSSAPLNHKARSLDSACTQARKISKSSGPNAPASWGSLVRFRFPLPEGVNCEGKSFDTDRESLFKGPPTCLQITVYEKKFMSDAELGGADVNLESLGSGGQIEEWVPLRAGKDGITWFARIRLSLRFELLCLDPSPEPPEPGKEERCPSVGLRKIQKLSRLGAHEDVKGGQKMHNSISTPDLTGYFAWAN